MKHTELLHSKAMSWVLPHFFDICPSALLGRLLTAALLISGLLPGSGSCQTTYSAATTDGVIANITSVPSPGSGHNYLHDLNDTINPANGALSIRIGATRPKERGLNFPIYAFMYDSTQENTVWMHQSNQACAMEPSISGIDEGYGVQSCVYTVDAPQLKPTYYFNIVEGGTSRAGGPNSITNSTATYVYQYTNVQQGICGVVSNYDYEDFNGVHHPLGIVSELNLSGRGQPGSPFGCGNSFGIQAVPFGGDQHYKAIGHDASLSTSGLIIDSHGDSASLSITSPGAFAWPNFEDTNGNLQNGSGRPGSFNGFGAIGGMESGIRPLPGSYSVSFPGTSAYAYNVQNVSSTYAMGYRDVTPAVYVSGNNGGKNMCGRQPIANNTSTGSTGATPITFPAVTSITLPNGLSYQFTYDPVFGLINKITYPTGAWVQYTWDIDKDSEAMGWMTPPSGIPSRLGILYNMSFDGGATTLPYNSQCTFTHDKPVIRSRVVSYDGVTPALEQDFQYSTQWENGSDPTFWTSKTTTVTTKDLIRPGQPTYTTIYNYIPRIIVPAFGSYTRVSPMPLEDTIVYKDSSGKTLKTTKKVWANTLSNEEQLLGECTILDDGSVRGVFYQYAPYSWGGGWSSGTSQLADVVTDVAEYDYGTVSANCVQPSTTPTRETVTTYASFANSPLWPVLTQSTDTVTPQNIIDRPATVKVYDNGTLAAETDYTYDEGSVAGVSSAIGHDDTNYGAGSANPRGNPTTIRRKCFQSSSSCSDAVYHVSYDSTGQPVSVTDANGNVTQLSYTDNYTGDGGSPSGNTNTYVTQFTQPATNGVQHIQKFQWDYIKGELRVATDENGNKTAYFYNDPWNRLTETDYPDGGRTAHQYSDGGPNPSVTSTQLVAPGVIRQDKSVMDGFGNVIQTILQSDPEGAVYKNTTYDGLGRLYLGYNPSRSSSGGDFVQYSYDALGRTTSVVQQDSSTISSVFLGPCVTTTDEVGRQRRSCSDALGRLTNVNEDPAGKNYLTKYRYDALGDLICVEQHGDQASGTGCSSYPDAYSASNPWRVRQFFYDSLGHLKKSQNPESGTLTYTYDPNGNLTAKSDDRGVTINYSPSDSPIDALNRVTKRTYSDGTPSVTFAYDSGQNAIGRLSSSGTADGVTQSYSYDTMGRVASSTQCIGGSCASVSAQWTFAGAPDWLMYPSSRKIKYTYDAAGRPASVVLDSFNDNSVDYPYYGVNQNNGYWPSGAIRAAQFGNGLYEFTHQNNRLQADGFTVSKSDSLKCGSNSGANLLQLGLSFSDPNTGKSNGNVAGITDYINPNWSMTFGYDSLNRITSATEADNGYMQTFAPDAFGNMTQDGSFIFAQLFQPNNQVSGYCYDAAGNMLDQGACPIGGFHAYRYDAENRIFSTQEGATFTYDAAGSRVLKNGVNGATQYFYLGSLPIAELRSGTWSDYIFTGSNRIAISTSTGPSDSNALMPATNTSYFHGDQIGSARMMTTGTVLADGSTPSYAMYAPFGQLIRGDIPSHYKFTGKERDSETGLDYFGARYYGSNMGRWMSPDWAANPMSVPYADFGDPQSLNLYSYVKNNPITTRDLDGHCEDTLTGPICIGGAIGGPPGAMIGAGVGVLVTVGVAAYLYYHHKSDDSAQKNAPPPSTGSQPAVSFPGTDPTVAPGTEWEWRGKGAPASGKGSWVNPKTGEVFHPDLSHPAPVGAHWDYTDKNGKQWRVYPDGRVEPKPEPKPKPKHQPKPEPKPESKPEPKGT